MKSKSLISNQRLPEGHAEDCGESLGRFSSQSHYLETQTAESFLLTAIHRSRLITAEACLFDQKFAIKTANNCMRLPSNWPGSLCTGRRDYRL